MADGTLKVGTITTSTGSGSITIPNGVTLSGGGLANTPYFYGEAASTTTITRSTATKVTGCTNNEVDSDSAFDGETFTVPSGEGGVYFFGALLESSFGDVGNDGERILASFEKNGSNTNMPREDFAKNSGYNMQRYTNTISAVLNLSAGDTINVAVYNKDGDASGNANVTDESQFFGYKLITWVI